MIHFRHKFIPFKVNPMERAVFNKAGQELAAYAVTDVYEKCACGKTRVREVEGKWTLEEVQ